MLPFCSTLREHHHAVILKLNHFQHFIWKCESVFVKKYITFQSLRLFHLAVFSFQVKVRKTSKYYQNLSLSIISKRLFCFFFYTSSCKSCQTVNALKIWRSFVQRIIGFSLATRAETKSHDIPLPAHFLSPTQPFLFRHTSHNVPFQFLG